MTLDNRSQGITAGILVYLLLRPTKEAAAWENSADSKWLLLQSGLPQDLQHRHRGDRYPHHSPDPSDVPLLADQRGPGHFKAPGPGVRAEAGHHRVHPALADFPM